MADSVTLAGIVITLVEGYPKCSNNIQTWRYSVEFEGGTEPTTEISNFAFELCNPEHTVISFSPLDGGVFDEDNAEPCLADEFDATRQMKWEDRNNENTEGIYEFSLLGCFESCDINIAVKAGNDCHFEQITGPCCQSIARGLKFSNFKNTTIEY